MVPILNWNQINAWINGHLKTQLSNWTAAHKNLGNHLYALKLKDNAMFPRFDSNTIVIIDPKLVPTHNSFVIVHVKQINDIVFRQLSCENNKRILYAYNEAGYKTLPLLEEDTLLGCMVEAKWTASFS
jgi:hypothetical protein